MSETGPVARTARLPLGLSDPAKDKVAVHLVYGLYAASLVFGVPAVLGVIVAYLKRGDVAGTWLESHVRWQIRSFWIWLLLFLVGSGGAILLFGWLILAAAQLWLLWRVVKGWLRLADDRPVD